jgi:spore coat protein U domain-containing protein, fimbrial subunit CupE1/2/3/6
MRRPRISTSRWIRSAALVFCLAAASTVSAGSISTTIQVTATVVSSCQVRTEPLEFGDYDPDGQNRTAPLDAQGTVSLRCSGGIRPQIKILGGRNPQRGSEGERAMSGNGGYLGYEIYLDPAHSKEWGAQGNRVLVVPPMEPNTFETYPVYGRIPAGQRVSPGGYEDVVEVLVEF